MYQNGLQTEYFQNLSSQIFFQYIKSWSIKLLILVWFEKWNQKIELCINVDLITIKNRLFVSVIFNLQKLILIYKTYCISSSTMKTF